MAMRMTSKGQVTIPLELRERYGLRAGTEVDIIATADGALIRPATPRSRGLERVAHLRDRADGGLDADAVLRLTRGDEPA
jgi:AbrB family looped-hinge helix DNA binding protein